MHWLQVFITKALKYRMNLVACTHSPSPGTSTSYSGWCSGSNNALGGVPGLGWRVRL